MLKTCSISRPYLDKLDDVEAFIVLIPSFNSLKTFNISCAYLDKLDDVDAFIVLYRASIV